MRPPSRGRAELLPDNLSCRVNYRDCVCPDVASGDAWRYENRGLRRTAEEGNKSHRAIGQSYRVDADLHPIELNADTLPSLPGVPDTYARVSIPKYHVVRDDPILVDTSAVPHRNPLNLSQQCVKGWSSARPALVKPKRGIGFNSQIGHRPLHTDPNLSTVKEAMRLPRKGNLLNSSP